MKIVVVEEPLSQLLTLSGMSLKPEGWPLQNLLQARPDRRHGGSGAGAVLIGLGRVFVGYS